MFQVFLMRRSSCVSIAIPKPKTRAEYVPNVKKYIQNTSAERSFLKNPKFIEELAGKAAGLAEDPICGKELFTKTALVSVYQQVLYCNSNSLEFEELGAVIAPLKLGGDTPIGTNLRRKILEPLVYSNLPKNLKRPLLISVITDGMPELELRSMFVDAIAECGDELKASGLSRKCVRFVFGQLGLAPAATRFLQEIGQNPKIADVIFVALGRLAIQVIHITQLSNSAPADRSQKN
ncbi:hypothetical protein P153DRAFT_382712 [Dothidotthia symphoricarpi CBS 119687]|uniref:Uncharacterized protein n=1 Tax=Dothidotthia symphoricarpi CBS 119687 TaxID=1392245 RepID=A0A6A6AL08_9PLEO|nr:uncharacterized protein P153DRAFT_382712 [Dothidotthia symphoricarpi CBS 119687]KAF2131818.1 hypothetical protein P153DRAFT_382712 [Dothidotthia symphoricarpi CBS 119687]